MEWTISTSKRSPDLVRAGGLLGLIGRRTMVLALAAGLAGLGAGACAHADADGPTSGEAPPNSRPVAPPPAMPPATKDATKPAGVTATGAARARDADTTSGAGAAATPSGPRAFCAGLARANEKTMAVVPAGHPVTSAWRKAAVCRASAADAWGLSLDSLHVAAGDASEIRGRWSLRHVRVLPDGSSHEDAPFAPETFESPLSATDAELPVAAEQNNLKWSDYGRVVPTAPAFYDFDGDGEAEAIVVVETTDDSESGVEHATHRGRVWTARAGIQLYAPARTVAVEDVRDIDGDGRPDLITRGPYMASATISCGSQDSYPVTGPALVAHATAGGMFASGDAVAADFARRECSKQPRPVMVRERAQPAAGGGIAFATSARNVACARLWGAATGPLLAASAMACRQPRGAACKRCDDAALLEQWARTVPPLLLTASRHTPSIPTP